MHTYKAMMQNKITAADLSRLLTDERERLISSRHSVNAEVDGILSEVIDRAEEFDIPVREANRAKTLVSLVGVQGLQSIWTYHDYREKIRAYQIENQISSIVEKTFVCNQEKLTYLDCNDQLELIDGDTDILRSQVPILADFFLSLDISERILVEVLSHQDGYYYYAYTTEQFVRFSSQSADFSFMNKESLDWEEGCGHFVDRDPPDKVSLFLRWGGPHFEKEGRFREFAWIKPDAIEDIFA